MRQEVLDEFSLPPSKKSQGFSWFSHRNIEEKKKVRLRNSCTASTKRTADQRKMLFSGQLYQVAAEDTTTVALRLQRRRKSLEVFVGTFYVEKEIRDIWGEAFDC